MGAAGKRRLNYYPPLHETQGWAAGDWVVCFGAVTSVQNIVTLPLAQNPLRRIPFRGSLLAALPSEPPAPLSSRRLKRTKIIHQ